MTSPSLRRTLTLATLAALFSSSGASSLLAGGQSSSETIQPKIEAARLGRDRPQLQASKTELEKQIAANPNDAQEDLLLARVLGYLVDAYEGQKNKKEAESSTDEAIAAAQKSIQLKENFAEAHSLLADLYGRKIGFGGMFAGAHYGPMVQQENKRAMELDDKNPRVWASLGRQSLMAPSMFGGNMDKAIESFQKSLALDPKQDETLVWLAQAYKKKGDMTQARAAVEEALALNPQNPMAKGFKF